MIPREFLIASYVISGLPLLYLALFQRGMWVWVARIFGAEKTLLILSIPAQGLLSREIINVWFLVAFLLEFIVLTALAVRFHKQKLIEVPKNTETVVAPEKSIVTVNSPTVVIPKDHETH